MTGDILIVDDNPDNLRVLEEILTAEGHLVRAAVSGEIALKAIAVRPPELIFLDIMMPGMDGFELCRRLKADPATAAIPVLFLSALAETEEKLKAFEAGGVDYVTKPFAEKEVLARVRIHLRLFRMDNELQAEVRRVTAELRQLNQELECRVAERTGQLEAANADLRGLTRKLEDAYNILKDSQDRLLQQEKMAAIGQLATRPSANS
ncbi:MAG: response regulator [Desulfuromonadaceae bacterium]